MSNWYELSTENTHITVNYFENHRQYFCDKCEYFIGGNLYDIKTEKFNDEIASVSQIDKLIVSERAKSLFEQLCPRDIKIQVIEKKGFYLIDIIPVAEIFDEKVEYDKNPPCEICGMYRSIICPKAFYNDDYSIFGLLKSSPIGDHKICRTSIKFGVPNQAHHIKFVNEELKEALEKLNCKHLHFSKCVDMMN